MKLWVDDEREPDPEWWWAKTSAGAIDILSKGNVTEMSLDYTLANKPNGDWDDGAQVLTWLKDHPDRKPSVIHAHSSSTSGCALLERMIGELE